MSDVPQAAIMEARDLYNSFKAGEIKTGTGEDKRSETEGADVPF